MLKVGLTGNIGSGKTTVARLFEIIGVPVYNADQQGRFISQRSDIVKGITQIFGSAILNADGLLDRKAVAAIAFNDASKLKQLNAIIHPQIRTDFIEWCNARLTATYVIHESAILFESGLSTMFDKTIMVTAPDALKLERVMSRDGASEKDILNRMANQWSDSKKAALSDFVITNDGKNSLVEQVFAIHLDMMHSLISL
jgi:dephospho-CoA kinase